MGMMGMKGTNALNSLKSTVRDIIKQTKQTKEDLVARSGYLEGDKVVYHNKYYPFSCAVDIDLFEGKEVVFVFDDTQKIAVIVGD